ncbi:DddA-like double-stranded DNA deaminase toxin [Amycolatopsis sp. NBC_00438]|uniref:DddA-like double-stranded DNA deaminase toxin n=1 Tax=Amycolatopsis sp. NBC_00438 TaxID=2903558 RepID=UPI002E21A83D
MNDFEAATAAIAAGIAAIGQAQEAARQSSGALTEATAALTEATAGSAIADLPGVTQRARDEVDATIRRLSRASERLRAYSAGLGSSTAQPAPQRTPPTAQPPADPASYASPPVRVPKERLDELRAELPPPVEQGRGQKTHGRWVDTRGRVHAMVSESDEWKEKVNAVLTGEGCPRVPIARASDVELRLAAMMREKGESDPGMRHVTLVINNVPCRGPYSCDRLLPVVLPDGYTITVHGTDGYVKTYTGGGVPRWR